MILIPIMPLVMAGASLLSKLGGPASGAAKGSADQRMQQNQMALQQQQLAQGAARDQFTAGMQGAQFQQSEQDRARKRAILSALMSGTQDFSVTPGNSAIASRMGTMTGGARPSALLGGGNRDALLAVLGGEAPIAAPTFTPATPAKLPTGSKGESILGALGLGGSLLGAILPMFKGNGGGNSYIGD